MSLFFGGTDAFCPASPNKCHRDGKNKMKFWEREKRKYSVQWPELARREPEHRMSFAVWIVTVRVVSGRVFAMRPCPRR